MDIGKTTRDEQTVPGSSQPAQSEAGPESKSNRNNILLIAGALLGLVFFGITGYYLGTQQFNQGDKVTTDTSDLAKTESAVSETSSNNTIKYPDTSKVEQTKSKQGFVNATYRGHYYNPTPFSYQYPDGWHVWFDTHLKEPGGSDDIINKINLHPSPYEISEFGSPAITGESVKYNNSLNEVFDPNKPCPVPAGEPEPQRDLNDFDCIKGYQPTKLDYSLKNSQSYCYSYQQYEGHSGWNKEYITCVVPVKDKIAFKFTLNNMDYAIEFQGFIESVGIQN